VRYLLVDKIIELEEKKRAVGIKNVTMSEDFLTHHFPQYPLMPGMLILESIAQLASWLIAASTDFKNKAIIHTLEKAKFKKFVRPGEQILLEVTVISTENEITQFKGVAKVADKIAALVDFHVKLIDIKIIEDVSSAKKMFQILRS